MPETQSGMDQSHYHVTILCDNHAAGRRILGEHGFACYIETPEGAILYDTGQGLTLKHNAGILGIDLAQTKVIVLSHGHYDHAGGLEAALELAPDANVFLHPAAESPGVSRQRDGSLLNVKNTYLTEGKLHTASKPIYTTEPTPILGGLHVTGPIPRHYSNEDTGGKFYHDTAGQSPDPVADDQALYFTCEQGLVIITGCAHAGIINTIEYIKELVPAPPIHAVIGGLHLVKANTPRLQSTISYLTQQNIDILAPCHCTGTKADALFWEKLPQACRNTHVGTRFNFTPIAHSA